MKNNTEAGYSPFNRIPHDTTLVLNLYLTQLDLGERFRKKLARIGTLRISEQDMVKIDGLTVLDFVQGCSIRPRSSQVVCKWQGFGSDSVRLIDRALAEHHTTLCSLIIAWESAQLD